MEWLLGLPAVAALFGLLLIFVGNFARRPRGPKTLKPNCLLTRSPVVFVTGLRSPFYFRHYWNDLPAHLVAHGYDVRVLRLPWTGMENRHRWFEKLLAGQACHLIVDRKTAEEVAASIKSLPVRSLFIPRSPRPRSIAGKAIEIPHRAWLRLLGQSDPVSLTDLGLPADEPMKYELLRFIRNEAEREWVEALSSTPENPIEESSKA